MRGGGKVRWFEYGIGRVNSFLSKILNSSENLKITNSLKPNLAAFLKTNFKLILTKKLGVHLLILYAIV